MYANFEFCPSNNNAKDNPVPCLLNCNVTTIVVWGVTSSHPERKIKTTKVTQGVTFCRAKKKEPPKYSREASGIMEKHIYFSNTWARRPPLTLITSQEAHLSSDITCFELYQLNTDRQKAVTLFGDEISNTLL